MSVLVINKNGGKILYISFFVKIANWTATFPNMPNGDYYVYAYHDVTQLGNTQRVGSALASATVNQVMNPDTELKGGSIAYGANQPVRDNGGARISAAGTFMINPGYSRVANALGVSIGNHHHPGQRRRVAKLDPDANHRRRRDVDQRGGPRAEPTDVQRSRHPRHQAGRCPTEPQRRRPRRRHALGTREVIW